MINAQTRIALAFTAGLCVGGGVGYLIADHHIKKLAAADLEAVQDMFRRVRAEDAQKPEPVDEDEAVSEEEDRYQTPAQSIAAEEQIIRLGYASEDDVKRTITRDPGYRPPTAQEPGDEDLSAENDPDLEEEVEYVRNISRNQMQEPDPEDVTTWDRSPDYPYVITEAEYRLDRDDLEKLSLNYYAGDHVLTEANDVYIPDRDGTVGDENLQYFGLASGDENLLHIRNERVGADFEIALNQGKFEHVIGFGLDESEPPNKRTIRKMRQGE